MDNKISYYISGVLPAFWEDFVSATGPCCTIKGRGDKQTVEPDTDGWYNIRVTDMLVTRQLAIKMLAEVNRVTPDDIVLIEHGAVLNFDSQFQPATPAAEAEV